MRLACASSAYDRLLRAGDLTQLEWLDLCRDALDVDGVVFDLEHFPRRDVEYLAQLKKLATDAGLTVAAVRDDGFFDAGREADERNAVVDLAYELGAPVVLTRLGPPGDVPAASWNDVVVAAKAAAQHAKARNVTLAVRNVPASMAAAAGELKRLMKDVDSTWLRAAADGVALGALGELEAIHGSCAIFYHRTVAVTPSGVDSARAVAGVLASLEPMRGFLCLDYAGSVPEAAAVPGLVGWFKRALAERTIARYETSEAP